MKILPRFPIFTINISRIPWRWVTAVIVTVLLIYGNTILFEMLTRLPPKEAVLNGLTASAGARTYTFQVTAKRSIQGEEQLISEIEGRKGLNGIHLQGSLPIVKAQVEIYQVGETMYRKDTFSHDWLVVPQRAKPGLEQLITELNPLASFYFSDNIEARYVGKEKINGKACRVYEVMTRGENKFMELYWQEFKYILWVDKGDEYIRKAKVTAEHRDDSQHTLSVEIFFNDYNENIEIRPPIPEGA